MRITREREIEMRKNSLALGTTAQHFQARMTNVSMLITKLREEGEPTPDYGTQSGVDCARSL